MARDSCGPPGASKLRLLLLERYAETDRGWWDKVFAGRGLTGRGPATLLDPPEPAQLASLDALTQRRTLLTEVMAKAASLQGQSTIPTLPAPGHDPDFDRRLAEDSDTYEPLFLAMAGVVAATTGAPAALALSRTDLAKEVAKREERRLDHQADACGISPRLLTAVAAAGLMAYVPHAALSGILLYIALRIFRLNDLSR
jgi:hypothetical protein